MTFLHITPGPDAVLATAHDFLLGDSEPSYYEPVPVCRCMRCEEDHTLGFGLDYDGPHYPEQRVEWGFLSRGVAA